MSAGIPEITFPLGGPQATARRKRLAHLALMVFTLMRERSLGGTVTEFDGVEDAGLIDALRVCSSYTDQIGCLNFGDEFVVQVECIDGHSYIIKFTLFEPGFSLLAARVAVAKLSLLAGPEGREDSSHNTLDVLPDHAERLTMSGESADQAFLVGMAHVIGFIDPQGEGEDDRLTRLAASITPRRDQLRRLRAKLPPSSINYDDEGDQPF